MNRQERSAMPPRQEPPMRQQFLSVVVDRLAVRVPLAALAVLLLLVAPGAAVLLLRPEAHVSGDGRSVPVQSWTTDTPRSLVLGATLAGLPDPGPNQKRSGQCDPDQGQEDRNGGCWVETAKRPPCPRNQWADEGRCWLPVAPAARTPTTGEPKPVTVADP